MATASTPALVIRPPEPLPACEAGESNQSYVARILAACTIESPDLPENASSEATVTPFNIGQIQTDLGNVQEDVKKLDTRVGTVETKVSALEERSYVMAGGVAGVEVGATSITIAYPSPGAWVPVFSNGGQVVIADILLANEDASFTLSWDTATTDPATINWIAYKR